MEMNIKLDFLWIAFVLAACTKAGPAPEQITDVYVADFGSEDIESCRPSDVDLNNNGAKEFFLRARQVDHKTIQDHYNYAPCYIVGTLKSNSTVCNWEIRAGATGHIECGGKIKYYACDTCDDLFQTKGR